MKTGRSKTGRAVIIFMAILGSILVVIGVWVLFRAAKVFDRLTREPMEPVVMKDAALSVTKGFGARDARVVLEVDVVEDDLPSRPIFFARANGRVHAATDRSRRVSPFVTVQLAEDEIERIIESVRDSRRHTSPGSRMRATSMNSVIERSTFDVEPVVIEPILGELVRRPDASRWIPSSLQLRACRVDRDVTTARWPLGAVSLRSVVEAATFESKDFDTNGRILGTWPSSPFFRQGAEVYRVDVIPIP